MLAGPPRRLFTWLFARSGTSPSHSPLDVCLYPSLLSACGLAVEPRTFSETSEPAHGEESETALHSGDAAISAALDAYCAVYKEGPSKKLKDLREETLAGLSWLHLNHEDVASALRRTAVPHQQLLASALGLVYTAHSGKPQWPTMPSRAIAARAVPGDSASDIPTKRCHCQLPRWRGRRPHRPDLRPAAP